MASWQPKGRGISDDIIRDYQNKLTDARVARRPQVDIKIEAKKKVKRNPQESQIKKRFTKIRTELKEELSDLEEKILLQSQQLFEIKELVEMERLQLERMYDIEIEPGNINAIRNLRKEKITLLENELNLKRKQYKEDMERKKVVSDLEEKAARKKLDNLKREQNQQEAAFRKKQGEWDLKLSEMETYFREKGEELSRDYDEKQRMLNEAYDQRKMLIEKEQANLIEKNEALIYENEELSHTIKRDLVEKDLAISEKDLQISEREDELSKLRSTVTNFKERIESAVKASEVQTALRLQREQDEKLKVIRTQVDANYKQRLAAQAAKIKEQDEKLNDLSVQLLESESQVQNLVGQALSKLSTPVSIKRSVKAKGQRTKSTARTGPKVVRAIPSKRFD